MAKVKVSVNKTIQDQRYEPFECGITVELEVEDSEYTKRYEDLMDELELALDNQIADRIEALEGEDD
jgi:hypothetical protein